MGQALDEAVGLGGGEAEGWQQTEHVGAGATGEDVFVGEQSLAHIFIWNIEFDTYHEPSSTYVNDMRKACLFNLGNQVVASGESIVGEMFALHHLCGGYRCGAGEMVSSEGGAQLSVSGNELWRDEHGSHRESVGDALRHGDDVGAHAEPLMGEEPSAAAVAALYLVTDEHRAMLATSGLQSLHELGRGEFYATNTLYALNNHRAHVAFFYLRPPCVEVV